MGIPGRGFKARPEARRHFAFKMLLVWNHSPLHPLFRSTREHLQGVHGVELGLQPEVRVWRGSWLLVLPLELLAGPAQVTSCLTRVARAWPGPSGDAAAGGGPSSVAHLPWLLM